MNKYYNGDKLLEYKANYNMIIGPKACGKTYWWSEMSLTNYIKHKKTSVYIRRYDIEIKTPYIEDLYSSHDIEKLTKGKYNSTEYKKHSFTLVYRDKKGKIIKRDNRSFCFTCAIESWRKVLLPTDDNIDRIIFDDFMTNEIYLTNEFYSFMSVISLIIKNRTDVAIFLAGNYISKTNPYFTNMSLTGIYAMKPGDLKINTLNGTDVKIAVEFV